MPEDVTGNGFRGATWQGWSGERGGATVPVTSRRLDAAVPVRNRMFPKIRSWFALGAPLELLSPLSVLRLLLVLVVGSWVATAWLGGWPPDRLRWVLAAGAVVLAPWLALVAARRVGPLASHLVAGSVPVAGAVVLWAGGTRSTALAVLPVLFPVVAVVGLFLGGRAVLVHTALASSSILVAELVATGPAAAAVVAAGTGVALLAGAGLVWLLVRSMQQTGSVDPDTGLPNGTGVARRLAAWDGADPLVVAVVALAGLADARDALGYPVATELLRRAVEDIGQVLPAEAVIGRIASDELVVAVRWCDVASVGGAPGCDRASSAPDGEPAAQAGSVAAGGRALAALVAGTVDAGRYLVGSVEVALRGHVGVALGPDDGPSVAELVRRAALGARAATEAGDRSRRWDGTDGTLSADDLALLSDLRLAAERGELWMAFQPQVDAATGAVVATEALLRWESPVHGSVPPGRFIPLAERTGMVDRLTEWVFGAALDAAARWHRAGIDLPVSVNVSARTVGKPDLADWILAQLAERDLPPGALTVEVTETAAVDLVQAMNLLEPLHERGVRVSMDDFGTGYTSLAALPQLPLDELKVDMGFVRRSATSAADEAIVRSVRELAHRLGLAAVAEGVEDADLARSMRAIGYDLLQGYHFARPMAEGDLLALLGAPAGTSFGTGGAPGTHAGAGAPGSGRGPALSAPS